MNKISKEKADQNIFFCIKITSFSILWIYIDVLLAYYRSNENLKLKIWRSQFRYPKSHSLFTMQKQNSLRDYFAFTCHYISAVYSSCGFPLIRVIDIDFWKQNYFDLADPEGFHSILWIVEINSGFIQSDNSIQTVRIVFKLNTDWTRIFYVR